MMWSDPRFLAPPPVVAAIEWGRDRLRRETDPITRDELANLIHYAVNGSVNAVEKLLSLCPALEQREKEARIRAEIYEKHRDRENVARAAWLEDRERRRYAEVRELYDSLVHGDPKTPRTIPFALAQAHGIFQNTVSLLTHQAMEKTRKARQEFQESYIKKEWESYRLNKEWKAESIERELTEIRAKILENFRYHNCYAERYEYDRLMEKREKVDVSTLEHRRLGGHVVIMGVDARLANRELADRQWLLPQNIYTLYVWLLVYPDLLSILSPYSTVRSDLLSILSPYSTVQSDQLVSEYIDQMIHKISWSFDLKYKAYRSSGYRKCECDNCEDYNYYIRRNVGFGYLQFVKDSIVNKLVEFLQNYKEGAFVMLSLLDAAHHGWSGDIGLPAFLSIVGKHPIEVLRLIKKLNDFMRLNSNFEVFLKYFDELRIFSYGERLSDPYLWKIWGTDKDKLLKELRERGGFDFAAGKLGMPDDKPKGVGFLKTTLTNRWDWFSRNYPAAASQWMCTDEIERWYSLNRAWDIVFTSKTIAYTDQGLVSALVHLLKDTEKRLVEEKQKEKDEKLKIEEAKKREEIERECAEKMATMLSRF